MAKAGMIIKKKKISDLKPAPYNPRTSTKKQEDNLAESLKKFGVVEPIIFNETTGHIVGGHFRVRELKKLGYKEVECVIVELSEADEKELNIRLNANTGAWDFDELANNWNAEDLESWGLDIEQGIEQESKEQGEREKAGFSAELDQASNYIVLKFSTDIDWINAKDIFELNSTYSKRANGKEWSKGIGRVVDGVRAIEMIKEKANEG